MPEPLPHLATEGERAALNALVEAWNRFVALPASYSADCTDFANGIHLCQRVLMARVARRADPNVWGEAAEMAEPMPKGS